MSLCLLLLSGAAYGQGTDDPEDVALRLADQGRSRDSQSRDWRLAIEANFMRSAQRYGLVPSHGNRLTLDLQADNQLAEDWRGTLAAQFDGHWRDTSTSPKFTHALREAYATWQPSARQALDVGRINSRHGVAQGYNPTDFFRGGASQAVESVDPVRLRNSRLGSVMLRGQTLWEGGSLAIEVSPRLETRSAGDLSYSELAATNAQHRWMVAWSQSWTEGIRPQWVVFSQGLQSPQIGLNLSGVMNRATVAYMEWSGGRDRSQLALALDERDQKSYRSRLATGLSYTTDNKVSITAEYDFNGAGLSRQAWQTLSQLNPTAYAQYRYWVGANLELPTRQSMFLYLNWQDARAQSLDVNAMLRHNLDDRSRLAWLELRYHWKNTDLALQMQHNWGASGSEFGALLQRSVVQLTLRTLY